MRYAVVLLISVAFCSEGLSQNLDSLRGLWQDTTNPDTMRLASLKELIWKGYLYKDPDSAMILTAEMLQFAVRTGQRKWEASALNTEGVIRRNHGDLDLALSSFSRSLAIQEAIGDRKGAANSMMNMGIVHWQKQDAVTAIPLLQSSLRIMEGISDPKGISAALNNLASLYSDQGQYDEAIAMHRRGLSLREEQQDLHGVASSRLNIGMIHMSKGDLLRALEEFKAAYDVFSALGDKTGTARALNNMASAHVALGDRAKAINEFTQARLLFDQLEDRSGMASSIVNIAQQYGELGQYPKALELLDEAIAVQDSTGDVTMLDDILASIATIHFELHDWPKARSYWDRCLALRRAADDKEGSITVLENLGSLCSETGDAAGALKLYSEALDGARALDDPVAIASCLLNIAKVHQGMGDHAKALGIAAEGLQLADGFGLMEEMMIGRELSYQLARTLGDEGLALRMHEGFVQLRDSLNGLESQRALMEQGYRYSYMKQAFGDSLRHVGELGQMAHEHAIERLRSRNRTMATAGTAALFLVSGSIFFFSDRRRRRARYEKDVAVLETQALRSQMNPHFIFNALNSISTFVQKNEPDKAVGYLSRFARLMRLVLENSRQAEVPLKDDLEALDAYMMLERTRGGEKFDYTITVDPDIDPETIMVPPLVVQPFVENAIWHGMSGKEGKGHITLKVTRRASQLAGMGEELVMSIEDDGVGRLAPKQQPEGVPIKKSSLATVITKARLDLVQKQKGRPAGFKYIDLPQGTRVEVSLPVSEAD